ncbi:cyclopropane fatty acyl phospholipid synthase [Legionella spiritensis]|uniref:cyclopropane fatty acyl phospholipid synthase n=1 Tax=Legionella spiritensis TaxID=452 RepID=UPI000F71819C|nr:cyclopropane fatty acyl phospholipid synthase [Legionella spiritensis]VEG90878.1 cyclopropane fatty acid synthase [Legionella spiritensis]
MTHRLYLKKRQVIMKYTAEITFIQSLLKSIGVEINGQQPWDIQIHNEDIYHRIVSQGEVGLGESYMDGWWDCPRLDMLFERVFRARLDKEIKVPWRVVLTELAANIISFQGKRHAKQAIRHHYDLGNTLFRAMLDTNMMYSCAYYKDATTLNEAQMAKLDLVCRKLQLKPGMNVLDIGCGWGSFAKYAAEQYGVQVTGVTISQQQYEYAVEQCRGLDVEIRLQDYRDVSGVFDRVVSIGMFEHVGHLNYPVFMRKAYHSLADGGLFLLHTIGSNETTSISSEWIRKYIFPNGMIPSMKQVATASESLLVMEDWQNFGAYYDNTLMAWHQNFVTHWDELKTYYDERFFRMWTYYLLGCAGCFRARDLQLWQIVFSKDGVAGGYMAPR